jgi:hypothetical protein
MKWFHGTKAQFDAFDPSYLGKGNDQIGSGFYFTDLRETAEGYAGPDGVVLVVELAIENPLDGSGVLTSDQITRIIEAAPDVDDTLQNFGEFALEGRSTVLRKAVSTYMRMVRGGEDDLTTLFALSNDFWMGEEAAFLETVREVTGYDGLVRPISDRERHAVAWSPDQIRIVEVLAMTPSPRP